MSYAFISYSTHNKDYAFRLAEALQSEGFDVWIDNNELRTGDAWWDEITENLRGCGAFVVIMTPEAEASKWVQREAHYADNLDKPFFPLLLMGRSWPMFANIQHQDVRDGRLPPPRYYEVLARSIPRRATTGSNLSGLDTSNIPAVVPPTIPPEKPAPRRMSPVFIAFTTFSLLIILGVLLMALLNSNDGEPADEVSIGSDNTQIINTVDDEVITANTTIPPITNVSAMTSLALGLRQAEMGNHTSAIVFYDQAINADSSYGVLFYHRGKSMAALGNYQAAIADFTQAITLDEEFARAYRERGIAYANLEDYAQALTDYTRAITLDADFIEAYYNRGVLHANLGQYQAAIADYTQVIALDSAHALAYNNRGVAHERLRDYDSALADFERALEINPNYTLARNNLTRVQGMAGP